MRGTTVLVAAAIVASGLAGCVGAGGSAASAAPTYDASAAPREAKDSDGLGAIEGRIVSDESAPVAGVDVALVENPSATTKTDPAGRFVLGNLEPGSYRLIAQRLGYESVARRIEVFPDAVTNVSIILIPLRVDESRVEVFPYKGFIAFSWAAVVITCRCNFGNAFGEDKSYLQTNLTKGVEAVVSEYVWQASGPTTSERFAIDLRIDDGSADPWVVGTSPLVVQKDEITAKNPKKLHQWVWMPGGGVYIAYQQTFEDWASVFYGTSVPENYTARPPS